MSLSVKNALIDMYSERGDIERALQIFLQLTNRDVIFWTAMITGQAMNGSLSKLCTCFSSFTISRNVMPNGVIFLGLLSTCSNGLFIDKGFVYFNDMSQICKLTPRFEHHG